MPARIGPWGGTVCGRPRGTQFIPGANFGLYTRWRLYVDDSAVHFMGSPAAVAQAISETTAILIEGFEEGLRMEVPGREQWSSSGKGKLVITITDPTVRIAISTPMRRLGTKVQRKAPHLGGHFQPGPGLTSWPHKDGLLQCKGAFEHVG